MANRERTIEQIQHRKISAIIRTTDEPLARDAMNAAVNGGFSVVEFTLTTPNALGLISEFAGRDDLLVGAGTVLTTDQATRAVNAGARFLVSPVCDPEVISRARALDAAVIPGTFTATEMFAAHRAGADFVKLFPAPADVATYIRGLLGPLPMLNIFPTAGVSIANFLEVLRAGAAGVGFVRSLFDPDFMKARDLRAVEQRAKQIVDCLNAR